MSAKIVKQVEYYFSDRNYPRDNFMQTSAKKSDEQWIPLETLMTFNKLKELSTDKTEIVAALREAPDSVHFELSEDGDAIRRDPSKPIAAQEELDNRTIYINGFDPETVSIATVQKYFEDKGFEPEHVHVRRHYKTRENKPSAFVQFATPEIAREVVASPLTSGDKDMEMYMKKEYIEMKAAMRAESRQQKRKEQEEAKQAQLKETVAAIMDKDCVVHFEGVTPDTSREDLKDVFEEFGEIAWVDFARGETEGYVRFKTAGAAPKAVAALQERKAEINGAEAKLRALEGDEEKEFWIRLEKAKSAIRKEKRQNSNKRRRGGRQQSYKRSKGA